MRQVGLLEYFHKKFTRQTFKCQMKRECLPDSDRVEAVQFTSSPGPAELTAATLSVYSWSGDRPITVYLDVLALCVCGSNFISSTIS